MKTQVIKLINNKQRRDALKRAVEAVLKGELIVFPTDTVYGLGANGFNIESQKRIYRVKGRSYRKPLPFLVGNLEDAQKLASSLPPESVKILKKLWPGPLTVIFETSRLGKILTGGKDSIAIRIPDDPIALKIIKCAGVPIAATSANTSNKRSAVTGKEAVKYLNGRVSIIIDGGRCPLCKESTILDMRRYPWTILREGAIEKNILCKYSK